MSEQSLPSVSVLMPAYNYSQYVRRAIQSALDQDYPPELLTIVVVDDGSTDNTPEVVGALVNANPGRITYVRQQNSGPSAAINRGLREARGELLAVLDADDVWLDAKTRTQARLLAGDPALGLVFCDMRVVDGQERTVRPSQVGMVGVFPRRALAQLLCQNVVTQSSLMIRRELAKEIPDGIPYSDWWFAVCAAQHSELEYVPEPLALYREHGANLTSSVSGAAGVREHRKELAFQTWALRNLDLSALSPAEVALVWKGVELHAARALAAAGTQFVNLVDVDDGDRGQAERLRVAAGAAAADGDLDAQCVLLLQALGWDPYDTEALSSLVPAITAAQQAAARPHPLEGARPFVTLVSAEELLQGDHLLQAYARVMEGVTGASLAIDASALPAEAASGQLQALVARCGLAEREDLDVLAVLGPLDAAQHRRMLSCIDARLSIGTDTHVGSVPVLTAETVDELPALVSRSALRTA